MPDGGCRDDLPPPAQGETSSRAGHSPNRSPAAMGGYLRIGMPELPDVEAARRLIAGHLMGSAITAVEAPDAGVVRNVSVAQLRRLLRGARLEDVERIGKWLFLRIADGQLLIHLGMTGKLEWVGPRVAPPRFERAALRDRRGPARLPRPPSPRRLVVGHEHRRARRRHGELGPDARRITAAALRAASARHEARREGRPHGPRRPCRPGQHAQRRDPVAGAAASEAQSGRAHR